MIRTYFKSGLILYVVLGFTQLICAQVELDPGLPDYRPVAGIAGGSLKSVGSDTMNNMMSLWTEEFKKMYPGVKVEVDGKGSSNALPALTAGQATFGPMSREAKQEEIAEFKAKFGYEPLLLETGLDMLAVYVHKDNPLEGLSFPEMDAIFSSTRKRGESIRRQSWSTFIKSGSLANSPITSYGRNAASGTYGYFKEVVLDKGDFGNWVNELPGSAGVVQAVGANVAGIGYSGIGYRTAAVKPLKLSEKKGGELVAPEPQSAYSGEYPLARFLYLAVNKDPRQPLDPMRAEFLRYLLSKQGQQQVVKDGYLPLTAEMAAAAREALGLL